MARRTKADILSELTDLATRFNRLTNQRNDLVVKLEKMKDTDSLANTMLVEARAEYKGYRHRVSEQDNQSRHNHGTSNGCATASLLAAHADLSSPDHEWLKIESTEMP